jgi:hypothetical protein
MDAPEGTRSAAVGGGITSDGVMPGTTNADVDIAHTSTINNDVTVLAQSGDASLIENTTAGSARTGDATAAVNITNIANSGFSLSRLFGILFINVFGKWNGSFGINTTAGNPVSSPAENTGTASTVTTPTHVFTFVPRSAQPAVASAVSDETSSGSPLISEPEVKDDTSATPAITGQGPWDGFADTVMSANQDWVIPAGGIVLGTLLLGGERLVSQRKRRTGKKHYVAPGSVFAKQVDDPATTARPASNIRIPYHLL